MDVVDNMGETVKNKGVNGGFGSVTFTVAIREAERIC
jgi:hypothetical protein